METCGCDGPDFVACETVGRDFVGHDEDAEVDGGGPCKSTDRGGQHSFSHDSHLMRQSQQPRHATRSMGFNLVLL